MNSPTNFNKDTNREASLPFSEALGKLLPKLDEIYDNWDAHAAQLKESMSAYGVKVTCSKGCGACCHYPMIPVTAGEAFVLLGRLLATDTLENLHSKFRSYADAYFSFANDLGHLPFTDDAQLRFLQEAKLPCPLFTKQNSSMGGHCSVWAAKPMICSYYHSIDDPLLCAQKQPHALFSPISSAGEEAIEEVRQVERQIFGRSTIGHLPLFLAGLTTEAGLQAFLRTVQKSPTDEDSSVLDFELFCELYRAAGYNVSQRDLEELNRSQMEVHS